MTDQIPTKIIERIALLIVCIIFLIIMGLAGKMDYEDAKAFEKEYMIEVCTGVIPNYKEWEIDCEVIK